MKMKGYVTTARTGLKINDEVLERSKILVSVKTG